MIISRWILLRMKNFSDKSCTEIQNSRLMIHNSFPEIMSFIRCGKYGRARPATDDNTTRRMRIMYCITKVKNTLRILLIALPRQQWLSKRASLLRYMYVVYVAKICKRKYLYLRRVRLINVDPCSFKICINFTNKIWLKHSKVLHSLILILLPIRWEEYWFIES